MLNPLEQADAQRVRPMTPLSDGFPTPDHITHVLDLHRAGRFLVARLEAPHRAHLVILFAVLACVVGGVFARVFGDVLYVDGCESASFLSGSVERRLESYL